MQNDEMPLRRLININMDISVEVKPGVTRVFMDGIVTILLQLQRQIEEELPDTSNVTVRVAKLNEVDYNKFEMRNRFPAEDISVHVPGDEGALVTENSNLEPLPDLSMGIGTEPIEAIASAEPFPDMADYEEKAAEAPKEESEEQFSVGYPHAEFDR